MERAASAKLAGKAGAVRREVRPDSRGPVALSIQPYGCLHVNLVLGVAETAGSVGPVERVASEVAEAMAEMSPWYRHLQIYRRSFKRFASTLLAARADRPAMAVVVVAEELGDRKANSQTSAIALAELARREVPEPRVRLVRPENRGGLDNPLFPT